MRPLITLCLLLAAGLARAAAPFYDIELLVFQQSPGEVREKFPLDPGEPDFARLVEILPGLDAQMNHGAAPHAGYEARPAERLNGAADGLRRAGGYRVIAHLAWRQPSLPKRRALPVHIYGGEEIPGAWLATPEVVEGEAPTAGAATGEAMSADPLRPPLPLKVRELDGTALVSVGKFLHVDLDLLFARRLPPQAEAAANGALYQRYRFRQHRRMRSLEIHYLDYPYLGVMVHATPYEPPEAKADAQAAPAAASLAAKP